MWLFLINILYLIIFFFTSVHVKTHPIIRAWHMCVIYMCICVCRLVFNMNDIIERTGWKDGNHISIRARVIPNSKAMKPRRGRWSLRLHSREKRARIRAWRHSCDYGTFGGNVTLSVEKKNVRTGPISRSRPWFDEQRRYILGMRWPRTFKLLFIRKDKDHTASLKSVSYQEIHI